jgi:hypothetical protein
MWGCLHPVVPWAVARRHSFLTRPARAAGFPGRPLRPQEFGPVTLAPACAAAPAARRPRAASPRPRRRRVPTRRPRIGWPLCRSGRCGPLARVPFGGRGQTPGVTYLSNARLRPGLSGARRDSHAAFPWQELRNRTPVALQLGGGLTPGDVRALTLSSPVSRGGRAIGPGRSQSPVMEIHRTGRGPKPRWLKAAIDSGKTLQDFAS